MDKIEYLMGDLRDAMTRLRAAATPATRRAAVARAKAALDAVRVAMDDQAVTRTGWVSPYECRSDEIIRAAL